MKDDPAVRGHLDVMLLAILSDAPAHGYAIIEELRRRSGGAFELPEGSIYPALHRLEQEGLLASTWSHDGRRRRVYELTRRGRRQLEVRRQAWRRFGEAVDRVLEGSGWPATA